MDAFPSPRRFDICSVVLSAVVLAAAAVFLLHCVSYFFVFDDFALIGYAAEYSPRAIAATPLFAFYRPLVFLLTKAQFAITGWSHAWSYAAVSLLLHGLNTWLFTLYARQLQLTPPHVRLAAVLFLLSPWASEAYFWVSARFDVLSTTGVLVMLVSGFSCVQTERPLKQAAAGVVALLATVGAIFSKEAAVVAPILLAGTFWVARERVASWWRATAVVAATGLAIVGYLWARHLVLPSLVGAYGSLPDLLVTAPIGSNIWKYLRAFVRVPVPEVGLGVLNAAAICVVCGLAAVVVAALIAFRTARRMTVYAVAALLVSTLPVIWNGLPPTGSGGGRLLYLPGVWFAMFVGAAANTSALSRELRPTARVAWICALVAALASVVYEAAVWRQATSLSRLTIRQLEPYRHSDAQLFVANMPFWYDEGPYVMKDYAFSLYFAPTRARLRGRAMQLGYGIDAARFKQWVSIPEYGALTPSADEHVLILDIPVEGMPLSPSPPGRPAADVQGESVKLTWTPGRDGGWPDGFSIEVSLDPDFLELLAEIPVTGGQPERIFTSVARNTYFVRIRAFNAHGRSHPSPVRRVVVH